LSPDTHPSAVPGNGVKTTGDQQGSAHGQERISTASSAGTGRMLALLTLGLAILLVVGFGIAYGVHRRTEAAAQRSADRAADAKAAVDVVSVEPTPNSYPLTLPGQTAGWYQSTIFARVDGYIQSWSADIGDRVKEGQTLAIIDTPELDQELDAAQAKVAASEAQVDVVESEVSIAKLTYDRWWNSPKGVVSEQERQEKKASYDSAQANLAEAKAQAQLDQADVGRYTAMKKFQRVTAPYDGIITARHVDLGDLVNAGSSASTSPLYGLAQSNIIRVFVDVPQKAAAAIVVGLPAHANSDQYPGRTFSGKVARSSMSIDPQTRTERVEVDIPNADLTLVPGMYVQVTFELNQRGLLEVPAAAILFRPTGLQVAVVDSDGKVQFTPITIAKDNGDTVELATGVKPGDRVALNISSAISPGQEVEAIEDSNGLSATPANPSPSASSPAQAALQPADGPSPAVHEPMRDSGVQPPAPAKAPLAAKLAANAAVDPATTSPSQTSHDLTTDRNAGAAAVLNR
jgi:RND family efflux transporter MFP subunit